MRLNLTYFTGFKAPGSIGAFIACPLLTSPTTNALEASRAGMLHV